MAEFTGKKMGTDGFPSQSTTFSSMSDDFLDMRFGPESRKVFEERIEAIEAISLGRTYDIPVVFFGNFDEKTQKAIKILVNEVIQNAKAFDLKLQQIDPSVHFYTLASWEKKIGKPYQKKINLPASKIKWENGSPYIQLIIPEKITTSEAVIKTVRLLFSKIYGKLFFDEHVPQKNAFRLLPDEEEAMQIAAREKVHFCRLIDQYPESVLKEFEKQAAKFNMKGQKAREFGKKEFFKNVLAEGFELDNAFSELVEETFAKNVNDLRNDPDVFFDKFAGQIFKLIPQATLLLPYDLSKFNFLKESRQWALFHALDERLQFTVNTIMDLQECRNFLNDKKPDQPLDYQISDLWKKTLNERLMQLKRKGLVKLFLMDGVKLTEKQKKEKDHFRFWIWRNGLLKNFPKDAKPEKITKRITEQYQNSIYQKLFETAARLLQCIKFLEKDETAIFSQYADFSILKNLFVWIDIRIPTLEDLLYGCKVGTQLSALVKNRGISKKEALGNFEKGWSYFVSFALIHQYYINIKQKKGSSDKRAEQFLDVIEKYTQNRLKDQPSFQISNLLIQIYKERHFNVKQVTPLVQNEAPVIDFFILNQQKIFENITITPEANIKHYCESVLHWQDRQDRNRIRQEEIDALNSSKTL